MAESHPIPPVPSMGPAAVAVAPVATGPPVMSVIDIGASGIRMLVAELLPSGEIRTLEELQRPLSLGRETFHTGTLSASSIQKAVVILRQFRAVMDTYHVTHSRAVATSAVRGALNRDTFVDRVFLATGIEIEVIEGAQETLLTFAAVQRALEGHPELGTGDVLLFELGGGATEWALMRNGEVVASVTHDMGTVRMRELLRASEGERRTRTRMIQHNVRDMMNAVRRALPFEKITQLIAIGSEARFAARHITGTNGSHAAATVPQAVTPIAAKDLRKLADQIAGMTPEQTSATYEIPTYEAESLGPALLAYAELVRLSQADPLLVARVSMRDGLVLQMAKSIQSGSMVFFPEQTIAAAVNLARKYQADERHGLKTAEIASAIFEATKQQHRMGDRERLLLEVASIVHDIGGFVAARGHHRHAYYLLVNSEIFGLSGIDMEIVANVARYHRRAGPQADHPAYSALPRPARVTVNRLAAILRVADALDKGHNQILRGMRVNVSGEELRIEGEGAGDLALERLALEDKGGLFEEVFGLRPVLVEPAAS